MRIDRLHLQNFGVFEDRLFEFRRPADGTSDGNGSFHLIIGENGQEKSAALSGLAVAAGSWFLGVRGESGRDIHPQEVRAKVLEFGDTFRIEQQFPVFVEATGIVMGAPLTWRREVLGWVAETTKAGATEIGKRAENAVVRMQQGEAVTLPLIA